MKRISILGSTGSIGEQTLDVVASAPERFEVVALAAGGSVDKMAAQVRRFRPALVSLGSQEAAETLRSALSGEDLPRIEVGEEGLLAVASEPVDMVVSALVGAVGLAPTLAAIAAGSEIALANKEAMVTAGALVNRELAKNKVTLLPVDSEHSAIFQALAGQRHEDVHKLILTASGGPFRTWSAERIAEASVEQALNHPNWDMGPKITIDSATLMNKGLELIEARWLFDVTPEQLEVVVHPQSIVHSLVEFCDGSVLAQLGLPDMRVPIAVALAYPERIPLDNPRMSLAEIGRLDFEAPDVKRFPAVELALAALASCEAAPAVLNAANEVAVAEFLEGKIPFPRIVALCAEVLEAFHRQPPVEELNDLADVLEADAWARRAAQERV
ncbi:MAG: 1-deoxy-D-xylulose-5-phosphate reductoisomerase [Deltaproteobacteria bacterium]|nr:1-deoxy-D-xylulose-5-phosphate reductoisomerase [Deltaproteobacteria bacterium]